MENPILIGMALVLILFVWVWIGIAMVHRMSLEKKIEKLNNITNPLPEEEKTLNHYKELRAIEQSKLGSAKWVMGMFMLMLIVGAIAAVIYEPLTNFFGYSKLANFITVCVVLLAFFCLPTFMGLTLASAGKKDNEEKVVRENGGPVEEEIKETGFNDGAEEGAA